MISLKTPQRFNIIGMLVVVAIVLVLAVGMCWYEFSLMSEAQQWVTHTYKILTSLERMESTLWDAETNQRGFIITGDTKYLNSFHKSSRQLEYELGELSELVSDNERQTVHVAKLRDLVRTKTDLLEQGTSMRAESGIEAAQSFVLNGRGQAVSNKIRAQIQVIEKREKEVELARIERADSSAMTLLIELAVLSIVSLGLFGGMAFAIKRFADERQRLSLIDDLTGIYNRRGFLTLVGPVLNLARRQKKKCSLIFVDMDGLKPINDNLGHDAGNKAIVDMSDVLKESFRGEDIVARWGGDEFVVFAFGTDGNSKGDLRTRFEERLNSKIEATKPPYKLSASLGIITIDPQVITPDTLTDAVHQADMNMYEIKKAKKAERH